MFLSKKKRKQLDKYKLRRRRNKVFVDIHRSKDNQFYSTIVAKNGKNLYTSEMHTRKQACVKTVRSVANQFLYAEIRDKS